jgi:tRNA(Ile)-lysidine synthase
MQLSRVLEEVLPARPDAEPLVQWPGASVRRYRNRLYLLPEELGQQPVATAVAGRNVELGAGLGMLRFEPGAKNGLSAALFSDQLRLEFRQGGEEFKPVGHRHTRKLKKLLQEEGVVPWMRDRLPLLYSGERLIAVGDLWLAADAVADTGFVVRWQQRPALH